MVYNEGLLIGWEGVTVNETDLTQNPLLLG